MCRSRRFEVVAMGLGVRRKSLIGIDHGACSFLVLEEEVVSTLSMLFAHCAYVTMPFRNRLEDLQRR